MQHLNLKPNHKPVKDYYAALGQYGHLYVDHEMAVRSAFGALLEKCARQFDWTLVPEYLFKRPKASPLRVDGALLDTFRLARGYWEAKDEHDDLAKEAQRKLELGYPRTNMLFQAPERAILWQGGVRKLDEDISRPQALVDVLKQFFDYREPHHQEWEDAVQDFSSRLPEIGDAAKALIERERRTNLAFVESFDAFYELCRQTINPNLSKDAVEGMLIQHLLTERIFRKIFDNPDFTRRNVIAVEIEKVIYTLTARAFNRDAFLRDLDRFYKAIELNAQDAKDYSEKQTFLNTVYERFFQGYSPKEADTHGIVYTPQPIVNFMVRSVEEILQKEFGRSLSDKEVHILDPFVGTGNFIMRVMKEIKTSALPHKYGNELHCNEVMLLPYYLASMNIEHEYLERIGEYKPFPGICLVDTFELAEPEQPSLGFMTAENAVRVRRQKESPIFVILGNPPYNAWQVDENDNNKNRKYRTLDAKISSTYRKDSKAGLTIAVNDPYVKAIRWASDRIGEEGIVAFVTNNSFIDQAAFDGMRKHLAQDFSSIYLLDLGGNVRKNPKLSGTINNVFGIQVGVGISLFIRHKMSASQEHELWYARVDEWWRKEQKYNFLDAAGARARIDWSRIVPDSKFNWLTTGLRKEFGLFLPLGNKETKFSDEGRTIYGVFSNGVKTNRDAWVYNFSRSNLEANMQRMVENYNREVIRLRHANPQPKNIDEFLDPDPRRIGWSGDLKAAAKRGELAEYTTTRIRRALYRPFTECTFYFDRLLNNSVYQFPTIFPDENSEQENRAICLPGIGNRMGYSCFVTARIPALDFAFEKAQCFPFYTYAESGGNRRENITDWALDQFRSHYNASINKWQIFYYVYAILHHPAYRERYQANLKRELPHIPFAPDFNAFSNAGERLACLHINYQKQKEYPLEKMEKPGEKLDWRVEKMRLSRDKTSVFYNRFLTLRGIPSEAFEYRLGNRSALEWIIDQYQVSTDQRSGIVNDPNRVDDPEYIVRLIGQVITISLETMKVVKGLPDLGLPAEDKAQAQTVQ